MPKLRISVEILDFCYIVDSWNLGFFSGHNQADTNSIRRTKVLWTERNVNGDFDNSIVK